MSWGLRGAPFNKCLRRKTSVFRIQTLLARFAPDDFAGLRSPRKKLFKEIAVPKEKCYRKTKLFF